MESEQHLLNLSTLELIRIIQDLKDENQSITERFHKQADYIINLEAKIERWKNVNQDLVSAYSNRNERLRDVIKDIKRELERYCSEGWTTKAIEMAKKALEGE